MHGLNEGVWGHLASLPRPCRAQDLGVAAVDIKKLKEGGINTIESLAFASKRELCEIKGMSDAKVAKIKEIGESGTG